MSEELADLIDALYDGSGTVEESGAMLTRCHEILSYFKGLERGAADIRLALDRMYRGNLTEGQAVELIRGVVFP